MRIMNYLKREIMILNLLPSLMAKLVNKLMVIMKNSNNDCETVAIAGVEITKINIQCYPLARKSVCENVLQVFQMSDGRKYMRSTGPRILYKEKNLRDNESASMQKRVIDPALVQKVERRAGYTRKWGK